jgi:hypothetical protein
VSYQNGYLDPYIEQIARIIEDATATIQAPEIADVISQEEPIVAEQEVAIEQQVSDASGELLDSTIVDEPIAEELMAVEAVAEDSVTEQSFVEETLIEGPDSMLVNFATLPPATEIIPFSPGGGSSKPVNITIREDGPDVIIDFVRGSQLTVPMNLRLEEVGFSGNHSPWAAGQFALSNSGLIHFPAGQARGRVTIMMASDAIREDDQQSTLRLREVEFANSELAVVNVTLEDDDQRNFESRLPPNTVAFSTRQVLIRESDPAVQIDLVRFNPDANPIEIGFTVSDITATEGDDYFAPASGSISFGPRQRSARLLIPLVQDASIEGDETFVVELSRDPGTTAFGVNRQIVVTIRDGESQNP